MRNRTAGELYSSAECARLFPFVTVDGTTLTEPVWKTARHGNLAPVPIIVGGQTDEWELFAFSAEFNPASANMTALSYSVLALAHDFDVFNLNATEMIELEHMLQVLECSIGQAPRSARIDGCLQDARKLYPASEHPTLFPHQDDRDTAFLTDVQITCMTDQMTRNHKHPAWRCVLSNIRSCLQSNI